MSAAQIACDVLCMAPSGGAVCFFFLRGGAARTSRSDLAAVRCGAGSAESVDLVSLPTPSALLSFTANRCLKSEPPLTAPLRPLENHVHVRENFLSDFFFFFLSFTCQALGGRTTDAHNSIPGCRICCCYYCRGSSLLCNPAPSHSYPPPPTHTRTPSGDQDFQCRAPLPPGEPWQEYIVCRHHINTINASVKSIDFLLVRNRKCLLVRLVFTFSTSERVFCCQATFSSFRCAICPPPSPSSPTLHSHNPVV